MIEDHQTDRTRRPGSSAPERDRPSRGPPVPHQGATASTTSRPTMWAVITTDTAEAPAGGKAADEIGATEGGCREDGEEDGHGVEPGTPRPHPVGRCFPNTPSRTPDTSPSVALRSSATFIGYSRLPPSAATLADLCERGLDQRRVPCRPGPRPRRPAWSGLQIGVEFAGWGSSSPLGGGEPVDAHDHRLARLLTPRLPVGGVLDHPLHHALLDGIDRTAGRIDLPDHADRPPPRRHRSAIR